MLTIFILSLLTLSEIASAVTITNTTNKDFILNISEEDNIILAQNATLEITDNLAENLKIVLEVSIANIYKIKDINDNKILFFEDNNKEVIFNIKIIPSRQGYHSNISKYQEISIDYWDTNKEDDALLVTFTKKPEVARKDAIDAQLNLKCNIF